MQSYAACDDPDVRRVVQAGFGEITEYVAAVAGVEAHRLATFMGRGMLLNVMASMDVLEATDGWAAMLREGCMAEDRPDGRRRACRIAAADPPHPTRPTTHRRSETADHDPWQPTFQRALDLRHHVRRAADGRARQPRRDHRAARHPARARRHRSRASNGPSTPTPSRSPCCCCPARRSVTASVAAGCSSSASPCSPRPRPVRRCPTASRRSSWRAPSRAPVRAIVVPLTLTLLSAAVPAERRGVALGAWGAVGGLAVALGPLVGGAIVEGINWHWIFWLNVPIGLVLLPARAGCACARAAARPTSSTCPAWCSSAPACWPSCGRVIKGNELGWTSPHHRRPRWSSASSCSSAFAFWERRAAGADAAARFFKSRAFSMANLASLLMYFGMFGSIFLLSQFLQIVQGYSPFQAGLRILPWTLAPIFVAPIAGAIVRQDRWRPADGRRPGDAGHRPGLAGPRGHAHGRLRPARSSRSSSRASAWACSSHRSRTSC